jgi:hypothetical protein
VTVEAGCGKVGFEGSERLCFLALRDEGEGELVAGGLVVGAVGGDFPREVLGFGGNVAAGAREADGPLVVERDDAELEELAEVVAGVCL